MTIATWMVEPFSCQLLPSMHMKVRWHQTHTGAHQMGHGNNSFLQLSIKCRKVYKVIGLAPPFHPNYGTAGRWWLHTGLTEIIGLFILFVCEADL